jgi:hypothetical protein
MELDGDSNKRHHAPVFQGFEKRDSEEWIPAFRRDRAFTIARPEEEP